jgi:cation transport regulator ChaC
VVTVIEAGEWHRLEREREARVGETDGRANGLDAVARTAPDEVVGAVGVVEEGDIVWGVVYRIDEDKVDEVRAYLGEVSAHALTDSAVGVCGAFADAYCRT